MITIQKQTITTQTKLTDSEEIALKVLRYEVPAENAIEYYVPDFARACAKYAVAALFGHISSEGWAGKVTIELYWFARLSAFKHEDKRPHKWFKHSSQVSKPICHDMSHGFPYNAMEWFSSYSFFAKTFREEYIKQLEEFFGAAKFNTIRELNYWTWEVHVNQ